MKDIKIHARQLEDKAGLYKTLKEQLDHKEFYGNNLDALWDVLTSIHDLTSIELIDTPVLIERLGPFGQTLIKVIEEACQNNKYLSFKCN